MAKKERRNRGVKKRVATDAISSEPGTFSTSPVTADDLREYRDVAAAFPPDTRNPDNSWEVHRMLINHKDRFDLIKQPWTEASLEQHLHGGKIHEYVVGPPNDRLDPLGIKRSVSDILRSTPDQLATDEVGDILLDMEKKGLVEALPDGQMLVKGTKEQLMAYGIDPTDRSIFEKNPFVPTQEGVTPIRHREADQAMIDRYMSEYSAAGYKDSDMVLAHGYNPGEPPMLFPKPVFEKALAAGEPLVKFTRTEMEAWRANEGEKANVRFVLDFNDDNSVTSTTRAGLDDAWQRNYEEVKRVEERIGVLNEKAAQAAASLLTATPDAPTPGWTHEEIREHLGVTPERIGRIVDDMEKAGHLEVFIRPDGEKAYRLNKAGAEAYVQATQNFDENDPRFQSKQWFMDVNTTRAYRR